MVIIGDVTAHVYSDLCGGQLTSEDLQVKESYIAVINTSFSNTSCINPITCIKYSDTFKYCTGFVGTNKL